MIIKECELRFSKRIKQLEGLVDECEGKTAREVSSV
jgi:hypothetical protein